MCDWFCDCLSNISYAKIKDFSTSNPWGIYNISLVRKLHFTSLRVVVEEEGGAVRAVCPGGRLSAWGSTVEQGAWLLREPPRTGKCASLHMFNAYEDRQQSAQCTPLPLRRYVPKLLMHNLTHTHTHECTQTYIKISIGDEHSHNL